ncbi:coiled-coil domain-containing protein 15 isoform X2 [Sphaeramia orbicularis]|uniref:Coiled-coil domain containing 15 n=1 Tax=Sphaeramia orbicularis TaxID=375764 RepID=A0A672Z411_9TELE|nr:coiled-coil domain-containing protein 15 isoform X2 [Sphaeramia orbicularis]
MSANRVKPTAKSCHKGAVRRYKKHRGTEENGVLAERSMTVVAVGAWVESGQDFAEHPSALALLTEELLAEKRRENEQSLQQFQDKVRLRLAQHGQFNKKRQQLLQTESVCAADMRQVKQRLAACRMSSHEELTSELPESGWNNSPNRHIAKYHMPRPEEEVEEEDVQEDEDDDLLCRRQHKCPLVQQKVNGCVSKDIYQSQSDHWDPKAQQVLWPPNEHEELKRQRQAQFLMHRRLFMNIEREQVKENEEHRKHLRRTARIKAEKEQIRLVEERKLERVQQLAEAWMKLEEREHLIVEQLRQEEEERTEQLQKRKKEKRIKGATRSIQALRARLKEQLAQEKLELPPLCCCASSFWDSHPDTCANNCVFHNNPKAYAQALQSALLSLDLQ